MESGVWQSGGTLHRAGFFLACEGQGWWHFFAGQMRVGGSWGVSCMYGLFNRRTRQVAYGLWNTLREPSIERGSPSTHDFFSVFNRPDKGMGRGTYPAGV